MALLLASTPSLEDDHAGNTGMVGDLLRKGKALWARFSDVGAGTYASSIAYFTFLSLIPLIALCISLISVTGIGQQEVADFFASLVPDALDDFTRTLVDDAFRSSGLAFSLSTITLLWTASKGIRALRGSLNAAYGVEESRGALALAATSVVAAIILGSLLAATIYLVFSGNVMRAVAWIVPDLQHQEYVFNALNSTAMTALGALVVCACYTYFPAGTRRFASQLPGAVLASIACAVLTVGFHLYVDNFCNFDALYGSIATVALFLFWMYLISYILIACAFINRVRQSG